MDVVVTLNEPDLPLQVSVVVPTDIGEDVIYCKTSIGDTVVPHPAPFNQAVSAAFLRHNDTHPGSLAENLFAGAGLNVDDVFCPPPHIFAIISSWNLNGMQAVRVGSAWQSNLEMLSHKVKFTRGLLSGDVRRAVFNYCLSRE